MKQIAQARYDAFNESRRTAEALAADAEDLKQIEDVEKKLKSKRDKRKPGS